ncbi:MAG: sensor domain-containing diguanylate cyclase [Comamonas sp.]
MKQPAAVDDVQRAPPDAGAADAARPPGWRHSLQGKVVAFMLVGFVLAYGLGAAVGLLMLERSLRQQWGRQAEMNAQIASAAIRRVYTFVAVETDARGQILRIVTERPLGDPESILDTGFSPVDVLAQAAAQTRQRIWLLRPQPAGGTESPLLMVMADSFGSEPGAVLSDPDDGVLPHGRPAHLRVGFARIGGAKHFVSVLPVVAPSGQLLSVVVSSIGRKAELYETRQALVRNALLALLAVLFVAGGFIAVLMRRLLRPMPALIAAITRIARNDTGTPTPYRERDDEIGRLAAAIETLREAVAERAQLQGVRQTALRLDHLAHHDALTGLPNRAFFNRALGEAVEALPTGAWVNLLLFDLDHFKAVNDGYGHAMGDLLLAAMAERVRALLRPGDVVARLGGDEFVILQRVESDARSEASRLASGLIEALSQPFMIQGHVLCIGTSVGIASAPGDGRTPYDLLRHADIALYAGKRAGRSLYVFYAEGMVMGEAQALPD